jgi:hypothetical protein
VTVETKAWKDMTKAERAARIKEGKERAKSASPDIDALVEAKVRAALAKLRDVQTDQSESDVIKAIAKKDPSLWTAAERELLRKEHERLQAALEAIPFEADGMHGVEPGSVVGAGPTAEYAPHTHGWFEDIENRRKDRNTHNGRPAELRWPEYQMHTIVFNGTKPDVVSINNVAYGLLPGIPCKLPTPHYGLYMESLAGLRKHATQFAPPTPSTNPGYLHVNISQSSGRPVAVLLGKGGLPDITAREALDVAAPQ